MAMIVKNNMGAQRTLNTLNQNNKKLSKALSKISSGMKIVGADDGASEYAISEKMREQIRSLDQDSQNVQNGQSLFKIAAGGIENIVEELRTLKELAINAANDTNNDGDRLTIQKEFTQRMANINDIATETEYNTKKLLDGTYTGGGRSGGLSVGPSDYVVHSGAFEPTNFVADISGNYTINKDGVYRLTGSADIIINAKNVKFIQANPSVAIDNVHMMCANGGNSNFWIENLNINYTDYTQLIYFDGSDNILNFKGVNNISDNTTIGSNGSVIIGDQGLTVEGGRDGTGVFNFNGCSPGVSNGFISAGGGVIGRDYSNAYLTINSGNYYCDSYHFIYSELTEGGDIIINGGTFVHHSEDIGVNNMIGSNGGNITIDNATIISDKAVGTIVGPLNEDCKMGDITISNSTIVSKGVKTNSGGYCAIGPNGHNTTTGNITIDSCILDIEVVGDGAAIGTSGGEWYAETIYSSTVDGDINIINTNLDNVKVIGGGPVVGQGLHGVVTGSINISEGNRTVAYNYSEFRPLKIHHGTQASQAVNFYIEDMHTKSLGTGRLVGGDLPLNANDLARYDALAYDDDLQAAWLNTLKLAQNKTLDDIDVITKQNANVAIRVIDGAIDYALSESTYIGSYLQRLEFTDKNIVTMNENVQAAESTIRDADMAKEMTEYTKFNVLQQASQSMLAQANQNASSVLSLLQ